jgi:hypothetical protein
MEVRTPIPAGVEHALAYAGTAGLMTLGYSRRSLWLIAGALFAYRGSPEPCGAALARFSERTPPHIYGNETDDSDHPR